jgi:hypothetical protein
MAGTTPSSLLLAGFTARVSDPDFSGWFKKQKRTQKAASPRGVPQVNRRSRGSPARSRPSDSGHGTLPGHAIFSESGGLGFGSRVHEVLGAIEWLPAELPSGTPPEIVEFLAHPEVRPIFTQPSDDAVVWRERAVAWKSGSTAISAQMDRVIVTSDRIVVVDFKTDQGDPAAIARRYTSQLRAYLKILRAWDGGQRKAQALIATVRVPAVIEVTPE